MKTFTQEQFDAAIAAAKLIGVAQGIRICTATRSNLLNVDVAKAALKVLKHEHGVDLADDTWNRTVSAADRLKPHVK